MRAQARGGGGEPICKALTLSGRLFEVIMKTVQIKRIWQVWVRAKIRGPGNHTRAPPYKMAVVPPAALQM